MLIATPQAAPDRAALRAQRQAEQRLQRQERRRLEIRCQWNERMERTLTLVPQALALWEKRPLLARELWLVLAVFESTEKDSLKGDNASAKTKWFDTIAPRARDRYLQGVSGFTTRIGAQLTDYLELSHNGYVYLTDLGMALVQMLRERYPDIHPDAPNTLPHRPLDVAGLMEIPPPRWRSWK